MAESISAVNHAHVKLHDQFAALIDLKFQAKNQPYTSITVFEILKFQGLFGQNWAFLITPTY